MQSIIATDNECIMSLRPAHGFNAIPSSAHLTLFLRYSEMLVENRQFEPTPPLLGAPVGVTPLEFRRYF